MIRMANALIGLAKSIVARPRKGSNQSVSKLRWIKFDKPFTEMNDIERRAAANRLANEMLEAAKDHEKE